MERYKEKILKELYDFQKEIIQCDKDCIIMNGARGSSKTTMIVKKIEYERPKNIVIFTQLPTKEMFEYIIYKLSRYTNLRLVYKMFTSDKIYIKKGKKIAVEKETFNYGRYDFNIFDRNSSVDIYWGNDKNLPKDIIYDYAFFEEQFPTTMKVQAKKIFSTVTCKNYNNYIERFFPMAKIFNIDYHILLKDKMYSKDIIRKEPKDKWYEEYAILDKEV